MSDPCLACGRQPRLNPSEICPACVGAPTLHPFEVWALLEAHGPACTRRVVTLASREEAVGAARRVGVSRLCLGVSVGFFREPVWTEEKLPHRMVRRLHSAIAVYGLQALHGEGSSRGKAAKCRLCGAATTARLRDARGRPICEVCVLVCAWCGAAASPGCIDEDGSPTCARCADAAATATHLLRACPRPGFLYDTGDRSVVALAHG